jgi:ArsR family transcriptional regulator
MAKKCLQCFNVFSAATRLKIIKLLRKGVQNVSKIKRNFNLTQPTISYHLKFLQKAGMLKAKKQGRETYYFLNKKYPCKNCIISNI